jgi:hypothetical protein
VARGLATADGAPLGTVPGILFGACRLGRLPVRVPGPFEAATRAGVRDFLADPRRSRPIGVYTWSDELAAIFRQDRMLQAELNGARGIEVLARTLHADPAARGTYEAYLTLVSRLTNPLVGPSLREPLAELDRGALSPRDGGLAFFPASRSHEADLIKEALRRPGRSPRGSTSPTR